MSDDIKKKIGKQGLDGLLNIKKKEEPKPTVTRRFYDGFDYGYGRRDFTDASQVDFAASADRYSSRSRTSYGLDYQIKNNEAAVVTDDELQRVIDEVRDVLRRGLVNRNIHLSPAFHGLADDFLLDVIESCGSVIDRGIPYPIVVEDVFERDFLPDDAIDLLDAPRIPFLDGDEDE